MSSALLAAVTAKASRVCPATLRSRGINGQVLVPTLRPARRAASVSSQDLLSPMSISVTALKCRSDHSDCGQSVLTALLQVSSAGTASELLSNVTSVWHICLIDETATLLFFQVHVVRAASREAEIEDSAKGKTCSCVFVQSAWSSSLVCCCTCNTVFCSSLPQA